MGNVYPTGGKRKARGPNPASTLLYLPSTLRLPGGSAELLAPS